MSYSSVGRLCENPFELELETRFVRQFGEKAMLDFLQTLREVRRAYRERLAGGLGALPRETRCLEDRRSAM